MFLILLLLFVSRPSHGGSQVLGLIISGRASGRSILPGPPTSILIDHIDMD